MSVPSYDPVNPRIALCLSGGGLRATLFHLGSLRRLNELGILSRISTFCSVSGGSITNGVLASRWEALKQSEKMSVFTEFEELVASPLEKFCSQDLRTEVLLWDRVNPINWPNLVRSDFSITDRLATAYEKGLELGVKLASLPESPSFVFCATNLERGTCWRFKSREMGDYDVGWGPTHHTSVAYAVAASSAYPVAFPPLKLAIDHTEFRNGHRLNDTEPNIVTLTDGGVYDNMGIEPVRQGYDYLLVADAGRPLAAVDLPALAPYGRVSRSLDVIWNQVGAQRKRWVIDTFLSPTSNVRGAFWSLSSQVKNYQIADAPSYSPEVLELLNEVRTDLDAFSPGEIACLQNHGYALANVAARKWTPTIVQNTNAAFSWPFPDYAKTGAAETALKDSSKRGILGDLWRSLTTRMEEWV